MDLGLEDDVALCTAATSGLGLASATALAREGADVAVCGTTPAHVEDAREQLEGTGDGDVLAVEADVTDPAAVEGFVAETVETLGKLDHVVTSAGGPPSGGFLDLDDGAWYDAFDLLVMSVVRTTRAAYPHLREGDGGSIVAITSRSVTAALDDLVLSNAVRRGVTGLVQTQAREFAPEVRVNAVLPGAHETGRIRDLVADAVDRGEYPDVATGLDDWAGAPLGRLGDPAAFGDVVAFLSSECASFVTGASLLVDGGATRS